MKTLFRIEPVTAFVALLWVASVFGAFVGGRMTKDVDYVDNSTNVIVNNNYAVSQSISSSSSMAVTQPTSNITIIHDFDVTNYVWALSNSVTNHGEEEKEGE